MKIPKYIVKGHHEKSNNDLTLYNSLKWYSNVECQKGDAIVVETQYGPQTAIVDYVEPFEFEHKWVIQKVRKNKEENNG